MEHPQVLIASDDQQEYLVGTIVACVIRLVYLWFMFLFQLGIKPHIEEVHRYQLKPYWFRTSVNHKANVHHSIKTQYSRWWTERVKYISMYNFNLQYFNVITTHDISSIN